MVFYHTAGIGGGYRFVLSIHALHTDRSRPALQSYLHDTLPFVRTQALMITFKLLAGNAEQEQNLLRLGVNKLVSSGEKVGPFRLLTENIV